MDVEEGFSGKHVDGQAAVPEGDAEAQLGLAFEVELFAPNGNFQDAVEGSFGHVLGIEQAYAPFLDGEFFQAPALEIDDDDHFFRAMNGDSELGVLQFAERFEKSIHPDAEAVFLESIAQFVQIKDTTVHRTAAPLWRIKSGAQPFKIGGVAAIDGGVQETRGSKLHRVFGLALDGLGEFFRGNL